MKHLQKDQLMKKSVENPCFPWHFRSRRDKPANSDLDIVYDIYRRFLCYFHFLHVNASLQYEKNRFCWSFGTKTASEYFGLSRHKKHASAKNDKYSVGYFRFSLLWQSETVQEVCQTLVLQRNMAGRREGKFFCLCNAVVSLSLETWVSLGTCK